MSYQLGLPGCGDEFYRTHSWQSELERIMRKEPLFEGESEEVWYNRCRSKVLTGLPTFHKMTASILRCAELFGCGSEKFRKGTSEVFVSFLQPPSPSMETIARGARTARNNLGIKPIKRGGTRDSLQECLAKLEQAGQHDSTLEERVSASLVQSFPEIAWERRKPLGPWVVDFVDESHKLCIEVNGYEYHKGSFAFTRDRQKSRWLQRHGYMVLRFAGSELGIVSGLRNMTREIRSILASR